MQPKSGHGGSMLHSESFFPHKVGRLGTVDGTTVPTSKWCVQQVRVESVWPWLAARRAQHLKPSAMDRTMANGFQLTHDTVVTALQKFLAKPEASATSCKQRSPLMQ